MASVFTILFAGLSAAQSFAAEVNVYSGRQEALIKPLLDKFTAQTGVKVNLVTGKADALISRAASEGEFSQVDLLVMADAGRLVRAKNMRLTQAIGLDLPALSSSFIDEEKHWVALTTRARTVMYKKGSDVVLPESMLALADKKYAGQICVRSSSNIYNQSMTAAMMLDKGDEVTSKWAKGIAENMARKPKGGDRDQIKAMIAGECQFAIANTYYLGGMLTSSDESQREIAEQVAIAWTPKSEGGTHINISGVSIAKHAPNKAAAEQLLTFMLAEEQQAWYAEVNQEYPVIDGVNWSKTLERLGRFDAQSVNFNDMGRLNGDALKLMDKAGWQ
ncbi:extracellular solute-binding protein [Agaribacter marinus]|uniref:Iron ABC transporter substrate-binding protein n=1 Tax=Agaribacter marinus TaxID=1431249 RepID=A0AA37T1T0_9ALTE|nr:extracellular solute-binding protein [Agaribacter marinus]GLR72056.1 iron ABC transporter substrate-binding protein [Agaribacter marinus]